LSHKLSQFSHATVRAAALRGFGTLLEAHGQSAASILKSAGLAPGAERDPDLRLPVAAVVAALELAARATGLDDFGLRLAEQRGFSNLGPISALARDEPDLRSALDVMMAFLPLHNDVLEVRIQDAGDVVILSVMLHDPGNSLQAIDVAVAMLHRILATLLGDGWVPQQVCFERDRPRQFDFAERFFRTRPLYAQDFSGLVVAHADLDRPNLRAEAGLRPYTAALKQQFGSSDGQLVPDVRRIVGMLLPTKRCKAAVVAGQLGLSRRSLDRRLAKEGESFQSIVDGVRCEIATRHLHGSQRRLTDIAGLVGFQSLSAFSAWFQATFGEPPTKIRTEGRRPVLDGEPA
jgi:AraC-like DNA-binding protein